MTAIARHKYIVVLGSCCTADAIRAENLEDIRGARLRLLWYQGRTSLVSMTTGGLEPHEFTYASECEQETKMNWGLSMVSDELKKRQQARLLEVIGMSDALIIDTVSAFVFPYLIASHGRYFLQSTEWDRYVVPRIEFEQTRLWEIPIQLSVVAARQVLEALYDQQPSLRVIFHLPRPCFNDGVRFEDPEVTANVDYYTEYSERLYSEEARAFPRVNVVSCGGEIADPFRYNGPYPFHYHESYMDALRREIERLME